MVKKCLKNSDWKHIIIYINLIEKFEDSIGINLSKVQKFIKKMILEQWQMEEQIGELKFNFLESIKILDCMKTVCFEGLNKWEKLQHIKVYRG